MCTSGQTPFVYVGAADTSFAWHREDANLSSVNHLLWGGDKLWFCVHPADTSIVLGLVRARWPDWDEGCHLPLQHKWTCMDPALPARADARVAAARQRPGDVMVTPPGGLHEGFNTAANLAAAVNTMSWAAQDWSLAWSAAQFSARSRCAPCARAAFLDVSALKRRILTDRPDWAERLPPAHVVPDPPPHIDCLSVSYKQAHPAEADAQEARSAAYQVAIRAQYPAIPRFFFSRAERAAFPPDAEPPDFSPLTTRGYWRVAGLPDRRWTLGTIGARQARWTLGTLCAVCRRGVRRVQAGRPPPDGGRARGTPHGAGRPPLHRPL